MHVGVYNLVGANDKRFARGAHGYAVYKRLQAFNYHARDVETAAREGREDTEDGEQRRECDRLESLALTDSLARAMLDHLSRK